MSNEKNISRGGLLEKMGNYQPDPPESVWEGIASGLHRKRSNRKLFIFLGAAAGLALAVSVGITILFGPGQSGIAMRDAAVPENPEAILPGEAPEAGDPFNKSERTGTRERLEQKVIGALQEVMEEQESVVEQLAGQSESVQAGMERSGPVHPVPGKDIEAQGHTAEQSEPSTGQGDALNVAAQRELTAVEKEPETVNEDSLVSLLQGAGPEIPAMEKKKSGKWQLGATLSPLISYRDASSTVAAQNVAVNNSESARLTYAGGVQISYLPTDRLAIQTGIYYNKMGVNIGDYSSFKSGWFESETDMVYAPSRSENVVSISNSMGTVVSSDKALYVNNYADGQTLADYHTLTPEEMSIADAYVEGFSQTLEYLEIPFNVRYKVFDGTVGFHLMGGLSANLLINNSISALAGDEAVTIGEVQDIRSFNYSGNAGLGMVYDVFENFSLSIEPRFRYYLNSVNTDHLPATRPYTFGFYTGINYKF